MALLGPRRDEQSVLGCGEHRRDGLLVEACRSGEEQVVTDGDAAFDLLIAAGPLVEEPVDLAPERVRLEDPRDDRGSCGGDPSRAGVVDDLEGRDAAGLVVDVVPLPVGLGSGGGVALAVGVGDRARVLALLGRGRLPAES